MYESTIRIWTLSCMTCGKEGSYDEVMHRCCKGNRFPNYAYEDVDRIKEEARVDTLYISDRIMIGGRVNPQHLITVGINTAGKDYICCSTSLKVLPYRNTTSWDFLFEDSHGTQMKTLGSMGWILVDTS